MLTCIGALHALVTYIKLEQEFRTTHKVQELLALSECWEIESQSALEVWSFANDLVDAPHQ